MPRTQATSLAKNLPRQPRKILETAEQTVGQDRPRDLRATGPASEALDATDIQVVDRPVSKEKMEMLAFMEEELTVMVHDSTNPTDEPIVEVFNDGKPQRFIRGMEQKVKRKYVEVLARAKKTVYSQEELPNKGGYRNVPHTALRYPFAVLHDANPRGRDWLKALLSEV